MAPTLTGSDGTDPGKDPMSVVSMVRGGVAHMGPAGPAPSSVAGSIPPSGPYPAASGPMASRQPGPGSSIGHVGSTTTPGPGVASRSAAASRAPAAWGWLYAVKRDGTDGERFALSGDWVEIGRDAADLAFDDRYLAPRHARFEQQPASPGSSAGGCRIVPIDLLNGVYRRVRGAYALPTGTHLLIGRELLRFDLVDEDEREATPLVRLGVALLGSPPRKPWGRLTQALSSGGVRDIRHLYGPEMIIGREEGDILFRDDEFLSRRHASMRWQGGQCVLEDLKSSNGTFIRLRGPQPLENGDTLRMGDQMFRIELSGS
jgi:pSer/pThr/pTyr-binding forkhead associated (FHA) protein